ncbi:uncharacterized protein LOC114076956 [Solanum pennellii]|uniref:Uncharacterized protein LOC114076956 n=1 Tax=Solanum pennellii TaxID=28526 RepID=A0ABM1V9Y9_SOLPN|nr:uncharacterized protein LOC114076956 [Solanum pennellii]
MCARHIWNNWHVNWKGERRKQFWRCSKASFEVKFGEKVHAMSKLVWGGALLNLQVKEIQANKVILKHDLQWKVHIQWEVHHILLPESHKQLQNQVNQLLFVLTQHLCQDLLKIEFKLGLKEDWEEQKLMQEKPHLLLKGLVLLVNCHLYQVTRDHIVLPHLLLLLEKTKGLQLVLMFTLILQLEPKYLLLVNQVRRFCIGQ